MTITGRLLSSATISESRSSPPSRSGVARVVEIDQQRVIGIHPANASRTSAGDLALIHAVALGMKQQLQRFENVGLIVGRENARGAVLWGMGRPVRSLERARILRLWPKSA
jgi:hypothetical protein